MKAGSPGEPEGDQDDRPVFLRKAKEAIGAMAEEVSPIDFSDDRSGSGGGLPYTAANDHAICINYRCVKEKAASQQEALWG